MKDVNDHISGMECRQRTCRYLAALKAAGPLLAAAWLLLVVPVLAQPSPARPGDAGRASGATELWITLGADAFEALQEQPGLPPVRELAARGDVVLTRVRVQDLETISARLHEATRRCGGFIAHRTLERARRALAAAARESAARAPIDYTIDQQALVGSLEPAIQKPAILATIEHLSTAFNNRYHAHPSGVAAAQWIHDLWLGYAQNRADVTVELVSHSGVNQPSVVLTIPGTDLSDEVVILGGHLDSTAFGSGDPEFLAPGADDDASGIAALSEVIRVAMAEGYFPQRTIQFMGYAAEEIGLVGSQDIAADYQAAGTDVVAVLQLDMTGYFGSAEDIGLVSDFTDASLTSFLGELVDAYQPELLWTTTACGYGCSDHASWHFEGFPASFSFESRFGQHNPSIHTPSDTVATLGNSADHAYKFARLALAFMVEIGKDAFVGIFADGYESGSTAAWSLTVH